MLYNSFPMHKYSEVKVLPYKPIQLHALVLNVEAYPQFLPWCRAARITQRTDSKLTAELVIHFAHLTERYTSRIVATPPSDTTIGSIDVTLVQGPFRHLTNLWQFKHHPEGCEISLNLSFEFKSAILDRLIGSMFDRACRKMVDAFTQRAQALYAEN